MIGAGVAIGGCVMLVAAMLRVVVGPTLYDRLASANVALIAIAIVCAAIAETANWSAGVDLALALGGCVLVLNAAALKFFRVRTFQPPLARDEGRP
ncbi:MAG: hypothetical protein ABUL73_00370 [Alphaproteobacteria bacterium]